MRNTPEANSPWGHTKAETQEKLKEILLSFKHPQGTRLIFELGFPIHMFYLLNKNLSVANIYIFKNKQLTRIAL